MGSAESREGRRASFGMDEEERVRVLQGIRLSENVVNRMKEPGQPSRVGPLAPPAAALGSSGGREKDSKPPRPDCSSGRGPPRVQVDPLERYAEEPLAPGHAFLTRCDWEQAVLQDELVRVATADRQAAAKPRSVTLRRGEGGVDQEQQRLAQRNLEAYRLSSQQFHEAATKIEGTIKPRRVEPVCSGLQAQILHCYRARLQEVLLCADLVRAYQHCVSSAHKG
ncbi:MICOS complex subunit MIC25 isoform X3 [Budorcas taxicolor]|uniref:MICOS complex subunit MIC25 isoform X3 n=1 Tax=Budorcas taxicolor TaxID=37181 RepID=UPI0022845C91|nr:MICOS complex subunit MIC25 isoform X3 [Budorcas taxicolor]